MLCVMEAAFTERLVTLVNKDQLAAIDDWRFKNRINSRGEAIRQLLAVALTANRLGLVRDGELHINLSRAERTP